jgi:hypothetical protein
VRITRLAALLLAAPLLQLNVLRAEIACATHEPSSAEQNAGTHHDGHGSHGAPQDDGPGDSDHAPAQSECCQALTSCSLVLGMDDDAGVAQDEVARALVASALTDMPMSSSAAPDPPPPKG